MKTIIEKLDIDPFTLPFIDELYTLEDFFLFDIETTGLSHTHAAVILIGSIYWDGESLVLKQIFCETEADEPALLDTFKKDIDGRKCLVTFNGQSFDIPFMNSRFAHHNINYHISKRYSLDVLRMVRKGHKQLQLDNYKLKTVEKYLGIQREDTISGKESVALYKQYERSGDTQLEKKILLHNYEDILYLIPCMDILKYLPRDVVWSESPLHLPLPSGDVGTIERLHLHGEQLHVDLFAPLMFTRDQHYFGHTVQWTYSTEDNLLHLQLPCFKLNDSNHTRYIIDIDLISEGAITFNALPLEDRLALIVSENGQLQYENVQSFLYDYIHHSFSQ